MNSTRYIPWRFVSWYICCGSNLSLVQIFFSFVSNSLSCYYHTLPYPKTKQKKIWTKDKIEPQHIHHYSPPLWGIVVYYHLLYHWFSFYFLDLPFWPGLLEAWLALTSVKYHGNLYVLIPLNQLLALTSLWATGPKQRAHELFTREAKTLQRSLSVYPETEIYLSLLFLFDSDILIF